MTRTPTSHRQKAAAIALATCVVVLLSSCAWYFNPADRPPEILLYDGFNNSSIDEEQWRYGTRSGDEPSAAFSFGHLEVFGPRHYLTSNERFTSALTVILDWRVTNGHINSQELPQPNSEHPDFSVGLDAYGLTVELLLYRMNSLGAREDTIQLVDAEGVVLGSAAVSSLGVVAGTLEIEWTPGPDGMRVAASVQESALALEAVAEGIEADESTITLEASGLPDDPRSLNEVYIVRERLDLAGLQ